MGIVQLWEFNVVTTPTIDLTKLDLTGFKVEARDGDIGKVDEATHEAGGSFIVVDTGPWIFGKKVMIPAGGIRDIDPDTETLLVSLTKEEIQNAPDVDDERDQDQGDRDGRGDY